MKRPLLFFLVVLLAGGICSTSTVRAQAHQGLVTSYTMSGLIHVFLAAVTVVVLIRLIQGRNALGTKF
ncbi:MAG: hypothetical protein ABSF91_05405 [Bacteroidota bacterium]|jgi:hypothetical protein